MHALNVFADSVQPVLKFSWRSMEREGSVPAVLQLAGGSSLSSSTSDESSSFETHILAYSFFLPFFLFFLLYLGMTRDDTFNRREIKYDAG